MTLEGEVFRGPHIVEGGARAEARGILTTRREIKELRERAEAEGVAVERLRDDIASLDVTIASVESAIQSLQGELHRQEKSIVGFELQIANAVETVERINASRRDRDAGDPRGHSAQEARRRALCILARIQSDAHADDLLNTAQRRLFEAREATQARAQRTSEAKATHAALVERSSALGIEVQRLEESASELETRAQTRRDDLQRAQSRRTALLESITVSESTLDAGVRAFDELRDRVRTADEASQTLRTAFEEQEGHIREARRRLEAVRAEAALLDVMRATPKPTTHLAS